MNRRHDICRTASDCRKSLFFQKKCLFSIPIPFRTLCWLCFCATVVVCCRCVLHRLCSTTCKHPCLKLGVSLFRRPCRKPLSPVKGCVCLVGFASCKALVHTRPASVPGVNTGTGVPATCLGATPQTPFL